jgi:hypothetical protein
MFFMDSHWNFACFVSAEKVDAMKAFLQRFGRPTQGFVLVLLVGLLLHQAACPVSAQERPGTAGAVATVSAAGVAALPMPAISLGGILGNRSRMIQVAFIGVAIGILILWWGKDK